MPTVLGILVWLAASAGAAVWACRCVNARIASAAAEAAGAVPRTGEGRRSLLALLGRDHAASVKESDSDNLVSKPEGEDTGGAMEGSLAGEPSGADGNRPGNEADASREPSDGVVASDSSSELATEASEASPEVDELTDDGSFALVTADDIIGAAAPAPLAGDGKWSSTPYSLNVITVLLAAVLLVATVVTAVVATSSVTHETLVTPSVYGCLLIGYAGVLASAITDIKLRVIPNAIPLAMLAVRALLFVYQLLTLSGTVMQTLAVSSLIGLVGGFLLLLVVARLTGGGIGGGDIKLIAALGFSSGVASALASLFAGLSVFSLLAVVLLLIRHNKLRDSLPFAPFLYAGFVITLIGSIY